MKTKFKSVAEAAASLADDKSVEKQVSKEIGCNQLVSVLLDKRVTKGMTQEEVADSMGIAASTVSRIESGNDRQLKWSDIVGYANALDVRMGIFFDDESLPAAARIKQCVFKIDEDLKMLASLVEKSSDDDQMVQGINKFYKEVLFNFLARFAENNGKLKPFIKIPSPTKRVGEAKQHALAQLPSPCGTVEA